MKTGVRLALAVLAVGLALVSLVWMLGVRDNGAGADSGPATTSGPEQAARGAYLARAGNCMLCHTQRGGPAWAGGRPFETPFGTVYSGNLTPDTATGIGGWTAAQFWRAMHHGRSRDGRLLVPVFPYANTTWITRQDSDALLAYLQSQPAVVQPNRAHQLRWPYSSQAALAVWRALYFRPGDYQPDPARSAAWNRGDYLVRGLGHCNACHATRNALGAVQGARDLAGGPIPMQNWIAPSLLRADEAGVSDWDLQDIVRLLQTGVSPRGSATGPMAEVVLHSTQYLAPADLAAVAEFLKSLPAQTPERKPAAPAPRSSALGAQVYDRHCAACHGDQGQGVPGAYPALAGNRAVLMDNPANLVQVVLHGGFAPATLGNPRPYGMPPFMVLLSDRESAAVLSHIRASWGNQAAEVSELDMARLRGQPPR